MKISSNVNFDEAVEDQYSLAQEIGQFKKAFWIRLILLIVIPTSMALIAIYFENNGNININAYLLSAGVWTGLTILYVLTTYKFYIRRQIKKLVSKQWQDRQSLTFNCVLDEKGISASMGDDSHKFQMATDWKNIDKIKKNDKKIEIFVKTPLSIIGLRNRYFNNAEDYEQCYDYITNAMKSTSNSLEESLN